MAAHPAMFQQAVRLYQQRRLPDAENVLSRLLQRSPRDAEALHLLGVVALETNRPQRAVSLIGKAINLNPRSAPMHDSLANALNDLGQRNEALASCDAAIRLDPRVADFHVNRGNILNSLQLYEDAVASYDRALSIEPTLAETHVNRSIVLCQLSRQDEALVGCDSAIALNPNFAEAHFARGTTLGDLGRYAEAVASFAHAITLRTDYAEAHYNMGNMLRLRHEYAEAVESYNRAIALRPDHAAALGNRGIALSELGRLEEALASEEKSFALQPDRDFLYGDILQLKLQTCDWTGIELMIGTLARKIAAGERACEPLTAIAALHDPALQRLAAETYAARMHPADNRLPPLSMAPRHDKIRIGYFSADFREHPVSILMAELFENHDRSKFHTVGFAVGPGHADAMTRRVANALDEFIDISTLSDVEAARMTRDREIDIAIDLGGFTRHARPGIFALRAAPIQVSYIGYLGTMGVDYMDYILGDPVLIPRDHQPFYREKVAYLPSYQSTAIERAAAPQDITRADVGLPEDGFVFCCFNNNAKFLPDVFRSWGRIVNRSPGSVLWLHVTNDTAKRNILTAADLFGLDRSRIVFSPRVPNAEYLARLRVADLFLDTSPYNAGTTASDALWMGLPVLTWIGEAFASRMAASLLTAIDMPELIAKTPADYEDLAIALAHDPDRLADLKRKLADNRLTTRLFDTKRFATDIEAVYVAMYERYQAGLPPDHITAP